MSRRREPVREAAIRLMFEIDHQVLRPGVCIPSKCLDCGGPAVDGGMCAGCLTRSLSYIIGTRVADQYLTAARQRDAAKRAVFHTLNTGKVLAPTESATMEKVSNVEVLGAECRP